MYEATNKKFIEYETYIRHLEQEIEKLRAVLMVQQGIIRDYDNINIDLEIFPHKFSLIIYDGNGRKISNYQTNLYGFKLVCVSTSADMEYDEPIHPNLYSGSKSYIPQLIVREYFFYFDQRSTGHKILDKYTMIMHFVLLKRDLDSKDMGLMLHVYNPDSICHNIVYTMSQQLAEPSTLGIGTLCIFDKVIHDHCKKAGIKYSDSMCL